MKQRSTHGKIAKVDRAPFEAVDNAKAMENAFNVDIPKWDDSDWALLYGRDGNTGWKLDQIR